MATAYPLSWPEGVPTESVSIRDVTSAVLDCGDEAKGAA